MGADHNLSRWRRSYIRSLSWWSRAKEDTGLSHNCNPKRMYGFDHETSRVLFRLESCKEGDSNLLKIEAPYLFNFKWEVVSKQDYQSREEFICIPSHYNWWSVPGQSCCSQIISKWGFREGNEDTLKLCDGWKCHRLRLSKTKKLLNESEFPAPAGPLSGQSWYPTP